MAPWRRWGTKLSLEKMWKENERKTKSQLVMERGEQMPVLPHWRMSCMFVTPYFRKMEAKTYMNRNMLSSRKYVWVFETNHLQCIILKACKVNQRISCEKRQQLILSHLAFFWTATLLILNVLICEIQCTQCDTQISLIQYKWIPTTG